MNNKTKVGHNWRNCACWIWHSCYGTAPRSRLWSRLRCLWVLPCFPLSAPISPLLRPVCLARVLVLSFTSLLSLFLPSTHVSTISEIKWHLLALICLCVCVRAYLRVFERVGGGRGGGYYIFQGLLYSAVTTLGCFHRQGTGELNRALVSFIELLQLHRASAA